MRRRHVAITIWGTILGILSLGVTGVLFEVSGMPPYPGDADGVTRSPQWAAGVNRYEQMRASFAARGIDQPGGGIDPAYQHAGPFNLLAICADFSDKTSSVSAYKFDTLMFGDQPSTVRDFYSEMSYGTLTMVTVHLPSTIGWQRLPQTYAYYVNNNFGLGSYPQNTQKLCEDLVDLVDPVVDFANYDNDGDGYVDGVVIVHAGRGAEFTGLQTDIWSHKWGIVPSRLKDGVRISTYSIQPEYWNTPGDMTIGVYAHEIGHLFGLPDLYDVDGSSRGIGKWSLMASGSWNGTLGNSPAHMDAWCKAQVGFLTPTNVAANMAGVSLPSVETSPTVYRLWADGALGDEYFLIENRERVGYDLGLPASGLLIWHIDDAEVTNTKEWYPGHTLTGHYLVALEQADGLWEMEKNIDYGDSGDPFPGSTSKTTFSAASTPNSHDYAGTPTYVTITNISAPGSPMTCDFQVSLSAGAGDEEEIGLDWATQVDNAPNPFNPATTIRFSSAGTDHAALQIYDILGRHVATLFSGSLAPGMHEVTWDGSDAAGHAVASGIYFARFTDDRSTAVRKMVLVR
ncbi:MAG: M6 family metalloprotease domain-containing protein [Candidatus Zixiibacteriota bacterium]